MVNIELILNWQIAIFILKIASEFSYVLNTIDAYKTENDIYQHLAVPTVPCRIINENTKFHIRLDNLLCMYNIAFWNNTRYI